MKTRKNLTATQKDCAVKYVSSLLSNIITDSFDREKVVGALRGEILEDIEDCADWQNLDEDEWCPGDVEIALTRALVNRIWGEE